MAFQPVPDAARFAVIHQNALVGDVINVFYFRRSDTWGLPELQAAAQALATAWTTSVMPHLSEYVTFRRVQARGERVQDDVSFEYVLASPVPGGRSGNALPPQCAFCVTHLTGLVGRYNRGRTFFGILAESDADAGLIGVGRADALRNALVNIRNVMANAGWTHVVVSRVRNRTRLPVAVTVPVVGYRYRDLVVDTQRRRKLGVGS
jgi:hypothetical protein